MKNKLRHWFIWVAVLSGLLLGTCILSLAIGSSEISFKKIVPLFLAGKGSAEYSILFNLRWPRIILGFAIGGALSLAGVMLQGMFRNPLVEPYTLGISGGAALGVCLNIVLRLNYLLGILSLPISGFLGALIVILLVYFLTLRKGLLKVQGLLLTGVMISFISSSLLMFILAVSRAEDLHGIIFWIMGSLEEPNWLLIKAAVGISLLGLFLSYLFSLHLNAFSLGEDEAKSLGINTERIKGLLFIFSSLLTGLSVSICGVIGFVGLVVPHFMRLLVGGDHRLLLISSYLGGAIFLILCDTLARTIISPLELPVGVITGIFGGILFIYALTKKQLVLGEK